MKFNYTALYAAILTASIGMVGCSSTTPTSALDSATTAATDTSVTGRITGFGSVFVDGVEFETTTSSVIKDGVTVNVPADQVLKIGMIVTLKGTANGNQGTATEIEFNDELEGMVQTNGIASGAGLMVMGQNVTVDANTNFESEDPTISVLEDIPVNAIVEISGYADGSGNILATFIELKAADLASYDDEMEVKGVIADLDTTAKTFALGNITVDYSTLSDSLTITLTDNLFIEVKFSVDTSGTLIATKIEMEDDGKYGAKGKVGEDLDIEGLITNIDLAAGTFKVNGQLIKLPQGFEMPAFTDRELVNLEVNVDANGDLIVKDIEKDDASDNGRNAKVVGMVSEIVIADDGATASITVDGKTFSLDKFNTIMKDDSMADVKYFNIADIATGDWLEMKVSEDANGKLNAVKVERIDAADAREEAELALRLVDGVLFAGDIDLTAVLSAETITFLTTYAEAAINTGEEMDVAVVINPTSDALEKMVLELEGPVSIMDTTVSVDGTPLTGMALPDGVDAAMLQAISGQNIQMKLDLVLGKIKTMKYDLSGAVAVDTELGSVTVDGTAITMPDGLLLENGENVELELSADGMVMSMDIERLHEKEDRLRKEAEERLDSAETTPEV